VAKIYRDLEQEGLLSRIRGSRTILNGLRYRRRRVRAFVGLPAVLANFITIPDYRGFFVSLRSELWLRGFATTMVFYRLEEAVDGTLVERLKGFEVDTVLWFQPGPSTKESWLRLGDMGIRVVVISQIGTPSMPSRYYVWKERAMETLLRHWYARESVRKIIVINSKDYRSPVTEEVFRLVVDRVGIEPIIRTFTEGSPAAFLRQVGRTKAHGIIFPSAGTASLFSFQAPEELTQMFRTHRVGLIDGPVDLPFADVPDTPVDLIAVDWRVVAESIVNDMVTLNAFDRNRRSTFEATAHLRVHLSRFSEPIRPYRSIATM
jgi:hypothetical protein